MDTISAAPNNKNNIIYIVLTVILVILSVVGIVLLFQIIKTKNAVETSQVSQSIEQKTELNSDTKSTSDLTPSASPTATVSAKVTPTIAISAKITPTTTPKASPSGTIKITPAPTTAAKLLNFESKEDGFTLSYDSSRKIYQDKEASGNRYTFYSPSGNIAVHVGLDGKWSWINPARDFSNTFMVAGMPTFKYAVTNQTIVDFQFDNKNYTVQCVHNNKEDLKAECDAFMKSIKVSKAN